MVSMFAKEPFTDKPTCVSPYLRQFGITLNDRASDERRQDLIRFVPLVVGTAGDGLDEVRRWRAAAPATPAPRPRGWDGAAPMITAPFGRGVRAQQAMKSTIRRIGCRVERSAITENIPAGSWPRSSPFRMA